MKDEEGGTGNEKWKWRSSEGNMLRKKREATVILRETDDVSCGEEQERD